MKKLKIISLCFLISLLFIPGVKAVTTGYNYEIKYSESNLQLQETYSNEIELIKSYILTHGIGEYSYEGHILHINMSGFSDNNINVKLFTPNNINSVYYTTTGGFSIIGTWYDQNFSINNGVVTPLNTASLGGGNLNSLRPINCNPNNENCTLYLNSPYYDASKCIDCVFSINNSNIDKNVPILLSNFGNQVYGPGDNISANDFISNFSPFLPNPYKCTVDPSGFRTSSLSNISDFEYRITADNLSSDDYGIEGQFAFQNSSFSLSDNNFNSSDYWEVEVIKGPDSVGDYNVNGVLSWDDTNKILTVDYGVYATDSEPVKVDCIIKLKPKGSYSEEFFSGTLNYYSCNPTNPNISLNDSYGYTDNTTGLTNSYDTSLMNFLNNTSNPDLQIFSNLGGLLPPGPVDSILTIPLQMLNSINNFLGSDCQPFNLTLPWVDQQVQLKCIRSFYSDINATTFVESVGSIASVVILVQYFVGLYNWIDSNIQVTHNKLKSWGAGEV